MRFEITGCATDSWSLETIQAALRKAGAAKVCWRNAFGWSNQPAVATFAAADQRAADSVASAARLIIGPEGYGFAPSLHAHAYREGN